MTLPSGLPEQVADEEPLARFLTSSGHFNATGVKHAAFLPNPQDGRTSVFRHGADPVDILEALGRAEMGHERNLHGAGIVTASDIREAQLEIEACEPPDLHADITGWPWLDGDREFGKAERKEKALLIAQKAKLVRFGLKQ